MEEDRPIPFFSNDQDNDPFASATPAPAPVPPAKAPAAKPFAASINATATTTTRTTTATTTADPFAASSAYGGDAAHLFASPTATSFPPHAAFPVATTNATATTASTATATGAATTTTTTMDYGYTAKTNNVLAATSAFSATSFDSIPDDDHFLTSNAGGGGAGGGGGDGWSFDSSIIPTTPDVTKKSPQKKGPSGGGSAGGGGSASSALGRSVVSPSPSPVPVQQKSTPPPPPPTSTLLDRDGTTPTPTAKDAVTERTPTPGDVLGRSSMYSTSPVNTGHVADTIQPPPRENVVPTALHDIPTADSLFQNDSAGAGDFFGTFGGSTVDVGFPSNAAATNAMASAAAATSAGGRFQHVPSPSCSVVTTVGSAISVVPPTDPTQQPSYDYNAYYGSGAATGYNYNYDTAGAYDPATGSYAPPAGAYDPATGTYAAPTGAYDPATGTYAPTAAYDATTAYAPGAAPYDPTTGYNYAATDYANYDPNAAYTAGAEYSSTAATAAYDPNATNAATTAYDPNYYANYDPSTYGTAGAAAAYTGYDYTAGTAPATQPTVDATTGYDYSIGVSSTQPAASVATVPPSDDPFAPSSEPFMLQDEPLDVLPTDTKATIPVTTKDDDLDLDLDQLILGEKPVTVEQKNVDSPMPPMATLPAAETAATAATAPPVTLISSATTKVSPLGSDNDAGKIVASEAKKSSTVVGNDPHTKMNSSTKPSPVAASEPMSVPATKVSPVSVDPQSSGSAVTAANPPLVTSYSYDPSAVYGNGGNDALTESAAATATAVAANPPAANGAPVDYGYPSSYETDPSYGYGAGSATTYMDPNYGYTAPAQVAPTAAASSECGYSAPAQVSPAVPSTETYVGFSDFSAEVTSYAEYQVNQTYQTGTVSGKSEHDFIQDSASRTSPRSMYSQRTGQSRSSAPYQDPAPPAPASEDYGNSYAGSQRYSAVHPYQSMDDELSSVTSMQSSKTDLRRCQACQKFNDPDANFCSKCGSSIGSVQAGSNVASSAVSRVQTPRPMTQLAEQMSAPARTGSPHSMHAYGGQYTGAQQQHHHAHVNQRFSAPLPATKTSSVPVTPAVPEFYDPLKRTGCPLVSFGFGGRKQL